MTITGIEETNQEEKLQLQFEEIKLNDHESLYGAFVFGKKGYPIEEFLDLLTPDQIRRLKKRIEDELIIRMVC